jgi:hypothetical protein
MAARKFNVFIFLSIGGCVLSIIVCGISVGTQDWYNGVTKTEPLPPNATYQKIMTQIKHGLFQGYKIKFPTQHKFPLYVTCLASEGLCMFSCGRDGESREIDIQNLFENQKADDTTLCPDGEFTEDADRPDEVENDSDEDVDPVFLSFALWLTTLIFLGGGILFALIGAALGLYNTFSAPFQPILSVFGLYIWNGIAAGCILVCMIVWGVAFSTNLNKTAAVSETLNGPDALNSEGQGSLGYSYWILIVAEIFHLANIAALRYRTWKIADLEKNNTKIMDNEKIQGEILLF